MGFVAIMKLLLFSDLHCDVNAAQSLVQRSEHADVLVGAGDFANCRRQLHRCLDVLRNVTRPIILVPGNNESFEELARQCAGWESTHVLHGSSAIVEGVEFFGIGGGIPTTPFGDWSFDLTEQEASTMLNDCPTGGVLVSHSPPKRAVDVSSNGASLGSTAVRATIEQKRPKLVVCGHIHGCAGQMAKIGTSTIINAGPAGIEWEFGS